MVFFIKYEFWPNYLNQLKKTNTKTFLISGIFRENQAFFKWYGGFYRKALTNFDYFFVQNESSKKLLQNLGFHQVSISGDTRFDRVSTILTQNNELPLIAAFKNQSPIIVIGSSWPKDEQLLVSFINHNSRQVKYIIAPHNIKKEQIDLLESSIHKKVIRYSTIKNPSNPSTETLKNLIAYDVLIIDTIGLLTKIYAYADIAYVGGGFGQPGVHNILEPATYGIPIVLGPNYKHFAEATALVGMGGCVSISNINELAEVLTNLLQNEDERHEKGHIAQSFVQMNTGATEKIIRHILA
jgi:3-deoxy-D-manno-octulosonic-acid transferase